ncbi:hypothetical protein BOTCAL_0571g00010 [Botryotinia calthae]|uniref:Heterokaryon incompatibility domain-containing protein n=1 Tax=Botryotinia calthae TaxID=38488 RepID=A0A4Y8CLB0_9HELO|nr:hypothetical protein BOTCAL_0571g00010 [Botryotinia calthae]
MVGIQARRRNDGESIPNIDDASHPLKLFTYEPLDPDSDSESFRLITIEPSLSENDALACKLLGMKYERYDQVARTQNDRAVFENIHVEGSQVSDIASETTVKLEETLELLVTGSKDEVILNADNGEREIVKELCTDGYWNGLWIIREIGRVQQTEVRFGKIVMSWKAFIEMDSEIWQNFSKDLGETHRENDTLMHHILEAKSAEPESVASSHMSSVSWRKQGYERPAPGESYECEIRKLQYKYSVTSQEIDEPSHEEASTTAPGSNLFLVKSYYRKETPWKTRIATSLARPGDLVCWIGGVSRVLLLRGIKFINHGEYKVWQELGTALFTRDFDLNDRTHHAADLALSDKEKMELKMDAATIYLLLS